MAVASRTVPPRPMIIDLDARPGGHRLAELLQALTSCSIEGAELAIDDPTPTGPASEAAALDSLARAMVSLRCRQGRAVRS